MDIFLLRQKRIKRHNNKKFPSISVGATENALLAAYGAKGKTVLLNCAVEPEVQDLIIFKKLGSKLKFR